MEKASNEGKQGTPNTRRKHRNKGEERGDIEEESNIGEESKYRGNGDFSGVARSSGRVYPGVFCSKGTQRPLQ